MAKVLATPDAIKSLADVESRFGLQRNEDAAFFSEWQESLPSLTDSEQASLEIMRRRLLYHRADGDLLEGAVTLLVVSPLLELAGFYDPPFKMKAEASVELSVEDGEETLRGRIDVLIMQHQFWVLVLESKKTMISARSVLPQALAYMMASTNPDRPLFGVLTNGDDVLFVKVAGQPPSYGLSRAFSLYTLASEQQSVLQILKQVGQMIV
jgi:hypothetical protein